MKEILKNLLLLSLLIGIFYLIISSSQKIFIASYDIDTSEPVVIETHNVGMKNMSQTITINGVNLYDKVVITIIM